MFLRLPANLSYHAFKPRCTLLPSLTTLGIPISLLMLSCPPSVKHCDLSAGCCFKRWHPVFPYSALKLFPLLRTYLLKRVEKMSPALKSEDLSGISRTHTVERENELPKLSSDLHMCTMAHCGSAKYLVKTCKCQRTASTLS